VSSFDDLISKFEGKRIVVLGDLAVDCYVDTLPSRLSREAPVLVLKYEGRRNMPGCAANTVMNLRTLGAHVLPIGIAGDDEIGVALLDMFRDAGVTDTGIVVTGQSVAKVRLMSGDYSRPKQQLLRVDIEPQKSFGEETMLELIARAGVAEGADGIIVSDYGYGSASPGLLRALRGVATDAFVAVDSRARVGDFENVDLLTPNELEAAAYLGRVVETPEEADEAARDLREVSGAKAVMLTRGNQGMVVADEKIHTLPIAGSDEIVDPSGAGDTVVAAATLACVAGASYVEAAQIATYAASVTVMKSGAHAVSLAELREAVANG